MKRLRRFWHLLISAPHFEHRALNHYDETTDEMIIACTCGRRF